MRSCSQAARCKRRKGKARYRCFGILLPTPLALRGEGVALRDLTAIGPPPWRDGRSYGVEHKWSNLLEHNDAFLNSTLSLKLTAPGATMRDVNDGFDGEGFSGDKLVPHLNEIDATLFRGAFRVPIFVIEGAEDLTAPPSLAKAFVNAIHAPRKGYVLVPDAGHFALFTRPDAFLDLLVARVEYDKANDR